MELAEVRRVPPGGGHDGGGGVVLLSVGRDRVPYACPLYLLERGSAALRELLADRPGADGDAVPLPAVAPRTFETVALYWEHRHGAAHTAAAAAAPSPTPAPPLRLTDLYGLPPWEQRFCVVRLLGAPRGPAEVAALAAGGRWVDEAAGREGPGGAGSAGGGGGFTLAERRDMWASAAAVCEAAAVLRCPDLLGLASAVLAALLLEEPREGVRVLLGGVPEFGDAERATLLAENPWLAAAVAEDAAPASAKKTAAAATSNDTPPHMVSGSGNTTTDAQQQLL